MHVRVGAIEFRIRGFNGQAAGAIHRVARFDDQVENGALELMHIDDRAPQAAAQDRLQGDALAERSPQELRHVCYAFVCIRRQGFQRLQSGERQKSLGQLRRATGAAQRVFHVKSRARVLAGEAPQAEVEIADDDRQHIVEVVGDPAGQLTERFHLLGLAKGSLGAFALGHFGFQRRRQQPQFANLPPQREAD